MAKDAKDLEVIAEVVTAEKPKRTAKKSVSYAVKAINTHVETLQKAGLFEEGDESQITEIMRKATEKFVKQTYGI